jgi:hypothetical protein
MLFVVNIVCAEVFNFLKIQCRSLKFENILIISQTLTKSKKNLNLKIWEYYIGWFSIKVHNILFYFVSYVWQSKMIIIIYNSTLY